MPPRVPGRCFVCGKDAMLENLLCEECGPCLAPPRREPVWQTSNDLVEAYPADAALMIEAGYRLVRENVDPDTGAITSQVWAKVDDKGR